MRNKGFILNAETVLIGLLLLLGAVACADHGDHPDASLSGETPQGMSDDSDDDTSDDTSDDDTVEATGIVAIIHDNDESGAEAFGSVVAYYGYDYYLVAEGDLPGDYFTYADVILVEPMTSWYSAEAAASVYDSLLPVLALGPGGLYLYDQFGLNTGFSHTNGYVYFDHVSIIVRAPLHSIFKEPRDFGLVSGDNLGIFNTGADLYAVDIDPAPDNVTILAGMANDDTRGTILMEGTRFLSWGFDLLATDLNEDGGDLLNNCLTFLIR